MLPGSSPCCLPLDLDRVSALGEIWYCAASLRTEDRVESALACARATPSANDSQSTVGSAAGMEQSAAAARPSARQKLGNCCRVVDSEEPEQATELQELFTGAVLVICCVQGCSMDVNDAAAAAAAAEARAAETAEVDAASAGCAWKELGAVATEAWPPAAEGGVAAVEEGARDGGADADMPAGDMGLTTGAGCDCAASCRLGEGWLLGWGSRGASALLNMLPGEEVPFAGETQG